MKMTHERIEEAKAKALLDMTDLGMSQDDFEVEIQRDYTCSVGFYVRVYPSGGKNAQFVSMAEQIAAAGYDVHISVCGQASLVGYPSAGNVYVKRPFSYPA